MRVLENGGFKAVFWRENYDLEAALTLFAAEFPDF